MTDTTTTSSDPVNNEPTIAATITVQLPASIRMGSSYDTEGRLWPGAGIHHTRAIDLVTLLEAGVKVTWTMPDGTDLDADAAKLLIAARQSDADRGIRPVWPNPPTLSLTPPAPPPAPVAAPAPAPAPAGPTTTPTTPAAITTNMEPKA
jgi:hypothetical protein